MFMSAMLKNNFATAENIYLNEKNKLTYKNIKIVLFFLYIKVK